MFKFVGPCTVSVSGQTGAGKTQFIRRVLSNKKALFEPEPTEVLYCYGVYQKAFEEMEREMPFIKFHSGLPNDTEINSFADINQHKIVIADDLMGSLTQSNVISDLFTRGSHHKNLTVIYINQNIFCPGKHSRTINLNTHYMIIMRNPRDVSTMKVLGRQLGIGNALHEAYTDVHKSPYSYLVTDIHPSSDEQYKLLTNIFQVKIWLPTRYKRLTLKLN